MYRNRYYVGMYNNTPAVYDTKLGLRAHGGTAQSMWDLMLNLAEDDIWFEGGNALPGTQTLEHLYGGKYHGPSNEAGFTVTEYWDMMNEWRDEQARLRDAW